MALTLQQRKERINYIGGSDCAAIFGLSKWATPLDIYLSKTANPEDLEEEQTTDPQEWGNRLEPIVIQAFRDKTNKECDALTTTLYHPEHSFLAANLDALIIGENAALEAKTARFAGVWGDAGSDQIPDIYLMQVAYYSAVCFLDKVYIAVLIGGSDFRIYEYTKNPKLEKLIIEKMVAFWNEHVLPRIPPAATNLEDTIKLWQYANAGTTKIASSESIRAMSELKDLKRQMKALESIARDKQRVILDYMEDTEVLLDNDGNQLATWKNQTANRFDVTRFKEEYPHMHIQYIKPTTSRVLRLKGEG
jgi:putative phage-type endonuclease